MQSPSSCSATALLRSGACADLQLGAEILQMLSSPGAADPKLQQKKKIKNHAGLFCTRLTSWGNLLLGQNPDPEFGPLRYPHPSRASPTRLSVGIVG